MSPPPHLSYTPPIFVPTALFLNPTTLGAPTRSTPGSTLESTLELITANFPLPWEWAGPSRGERFSPVDDARENPAFYFALVESRAAGRRRTMNRSKRSDESRSSEEPTVRALEQKFIWSFFFHGFLPKLPI